jgi:hypothetical protein
MPLLKRLFWVYFFLLIFEGALRKWVLPQLSAPLLLVRDPVALLIIWEAYRTRKWPRQWSSVTGILAAAMLALCFVQLVVGENPWFVALYGLRSYLLPFPVAFIMGENLDTEDLRKFGTCTLWLLLPLVALEVAQYMAAPSSFLNKGAYKGLEQITYAGAHVRASGTFSFVTGPSAYIPMAAAFIFYGIVNDRFAKKWLLWAASSALILAIPVTGSRGMLILLTATLACVAIAAMFGVSHLGSALKVLVVMVIVAVVVSRLPVFSEATDTFLERITSASGSEGGAEGTLHSRVDLPIVQAIDYSLSSTQWYGNGIGLGSNVASTLLTGTQQFLAGEGEFERVIVEFGGPCGLAFMLLRFLLAVLIAAKALSGVREGQPLAWFLVPTMFMALMSTLEQPTNQGFMVVAVGFSLAALNLVDIPVESALIPNRRSARVHYDLRA